MKRALQSLRTMSCDTSQFESLKVDYLFHLFVKKSLTFCLIHAHALK